LDCDGDGDGKVRGYCPYICYINLINGIKVFSSRNRGI
jgi:hypothetical protein